MRKIYQALIIVLFVFMVSACETNGSSNASGKFHIWSESSAIKIMKTVQYDKKEDYSYHIKAAKGEYEGYNLIISAETDVNNYDIKLSDLVSADGTVYAYNHISVYNQKYIEVISTKGNSYGVGWYPDALLPLDVAKAYGENKVEATENQALYLEFYIPYTQKSDTYSGTFELTVDGKVFDVPIQVTVWDFEITDKPTYESIYVVQAGSIVKGELNGTEEMYDKYIETLLKFRTAPHKIVFDFNDGLANWIEKIRYYSNEVEIKIPTIAIPVSQQGTGINATSFKEYVIALYEASIQDQKNYLEDAAVYMGFLDEPHLNQTYDLVNSVSKHFYEVKNAIANELEISNEFDSMLIESIRKIPNFITTYASDRFNEYVSNYSVHVNHSGNSALNRYLYQEFPEKQWWYSTNSYYPGYRLDGSILESRLFHWMTYDYQFTGDLFWETTIFDNRQTGEVNPYEMAVRSGADNGDGFLFYPGKTYGIDGPVTSLRLHAMRDGREEYEYLKRIEDIYQKNGKNPEKILRKIFNSLYKDIELVNDPELFNENRESIAQILLAAKQGVFFTDYIEEGEQVILEVTKGSNVELIRQNRALNSYIQYRSGSIDLKMFIGGKMNQTKTFDAIEKFSSSSATFTLNANFEVVASINANKTRISVKSDNKEFNKQLDYGILRLYNHSDKNIHLTIYLEGNDSEAYVIDYVLLPGENMIYLLQLENIKWNNIRNTENILLDFNTLGPTFSPYQVTLIDLTTFYGIERG